MRLGMIGLGKMGGNMARRLRRADIEVVGFNRDSGATQALAAECGLLPADSAEALITMLDAPRRVAGEVGHALCRRRCLWRRLGTGKRLRNDGRRS